MKIISPFIAALSFMTRLAPARIVEDKVFAATIAYFPLVGLVLGVLLTAPFYLGFFKGNSWVQAWLLLGGSLVLTRGLHWDGWSDLFDAWGSCARGPRFWEIMKDSHIGAFGVIALFMALVGQLLLLHTALELKAYTVIVFAFILGRSLAAVAAYCGRALTRPGLGGKFLAGANSTTLVLVVAQTLLAGAYVEPVRVMAPAFALCLLGLYELVLLAKREGAMNGDFLGAAVIWGELSALLGWASISRFPPF